MNNKTPAIVSAISTVILLIIFGILSILFEMVALNGASGKQGTVALVISLVCNGLSVILFGLFSSWFTKLAITKFNWNKILAVAVAVTLGTIFGMAVSFLSLIASILLAGVR